MTRHDLETVRHLDFAEVHDLALRRCGTGRGRFLEIGALDWRSTSYIEDRIRETGAEARCEAIGARETNRLELNVDDESLDFLFYHAQPGKQTEAFSLATWWTKTRPGGLIAGTGYPACQAVVAAVDEFVASRGLGRAFRTSGSCWLLYKSIAVDAIYCLNLPRRIDRRNVVSAQFRAAGILDQVTFFDAFDGHALQHPGVVSHGQAGCTASHLRVMQEAARRGARHALVFEDDVELVPDFVASLETALARCPATYDLLYVGALCLPEWGNFLYPFDDCLARAGSVFGTHAYVVNLERLSLVDAGLRSLDRVIDQFFAQERQPASNCYVCVPYLAFQLSGLSDVAGVHNANTRACARYVWR